MSQSMISSVVGIAVLLCVAIFSAARYWREHQDEPVNPLARHVPDPRLAAPQALNDTTYDFWKCWGVRVLFLHRVICRLV
jgi:hypothetical protein